MKYLILKSITILCFLAMFCSCKLADLNTKSYVDPAFVKTEFKKFCILVDVENTHTRDDIEQIFVDSFEENGINAVMALKVMPPTRVWTDKNISTFLRQNKFDGLLVVTFQQNQQYFSDDYFDHMTREALSNDHNNKNKYINVARSVGVEAITGHTDLVLSTSIFDVKSDDLAWISTSIPPSYRNYIEYMIEDYALTILHDLNEDGLINLKEEE
jgi:hypothetical protein